MIVPKKINPSPDQLQINTKCILDRFNSVKTVLYFKIHIMSIEH